MPIRDFSRRVNEVFEDCRLYGQSPLLYPLYVAEKKIIATLETLHLKERIKRCLRGPTQPVCSEVEFDDRNRDERYAVRPGLPRWPRLARYAIVVARKKGR
jgi:hypothetical protein